MTDISTLTTTLWTTLYDFLQTGTYELTTDNIFSAYNDKLIEDVGFPVVVIYPPSISITTIDMHGSLKKAEVIFNIEIYHKTAALCKSQVDEIIKNINDGYSELVSNGLRKPKGEWFESVDYDAWQGTGRHRIHRYTIAIKFRYMS